MGPRDLRALDFPRVRALGLVMLVTAGLPQGIAGAEEPTRWNSSTRFGGSDGSDVLWASALGPDGSLYAVGQTFSSDFPLSSPAQPRYAGGGDAFVIRIGAERTGLVYSTYLGGAGLDAAVGIAIGAAGEAYVAGVTVSEDFPGAGSEQNRIGPDLFVARLSADGRLERSVVIGGEGSDGAEGIALANDGSVFVVGSTTSADFPLVDASQGELRGSADGLVVRLDGASLDVLMSSFLGGSGGDEIRAVVIGGDGTVSIAGNSDSPDLPNPVAGRKYSGLLDMFVSRMSADGRAIERTLYLGGSDEDRLGPGALSISTQGLVVAGTSTSPDFPIVNGPSPRRGGLHDGVVALVDHRDMSVLFSSYLGGSDSDFASSAVLHDGTLHVAGTTASRDFPLVCPQQADRGPVRYEAFIASFDVPGSFLSYSTFAGSGGARSVVAAGRGEVIVAGDGSTGNLPIVRPWSLPSHAAAGLFFVSLGPAVASCPGDCCVDGGVTVDELVVGVQVVLGTKPLAACGSIDGDGDGEVGVHEMIRAVRFGLEGCEGWR